jgi:hypothetical protein
LRIIIVIVHVGVFIVVVHVGVVKTCVVIVATQKKKKGKTKNVTRMEALKKNESWLKFALVNL